MVKQKQDAIEFTQDIVAEIWEEHEDKVLLRECAEELWEEHREAARQAEQEDRLEGYIWETMDDVSSDEARVIAALVRQIGRDRARPAMRSRREDNPMYKSTDSERSGHSRRPLPHEDA